MRSIATWWDAQPAFLRDFVEGIVSAAIGGATTGVLALNLDTANPKQVIGVAAIGAVSAVIAFARHRLAKPTS